MSCINYKHYQNAVDSMRDALIAALNSDEETETLEDIWSYYLGMRSITDSTFQHMHDGEDSGSVNDFWMDDGYSITGNPGAASSDTISMNFSDLNLTGAASSDTVLFTGSAVHAAQAVPMDHIYGGAGKDVITFS